MSLGSLARGQHLLDRMSHVLAHLQLVVAEDVVEPQHRMPSVFTRRVERDTFSLRGWSIHEIGTARMGNDPKTSVTDRYCGCNDAKKCLHRRRRAVRLRRHAEHTWSILAMAWRTMDFLKERLRAGDV